MGETVRQRYMRRLEALKAERSSWLDHWRDLARHIRPTRGRFLEQRPNDGAKRYGDIINSKAVESAGFLASGMMANTTNPGRQWFKLATPDRELSRWGPVRGWLGTLERSTSEAFASSNTYAALHIVHGDLGTFATGVMYLEEDVKDAIRAYVWPVGQYVLAASDRGAIDTAGREFSMTVEQLVAKFGRDACSQVVKGLYDRGEYGQWVKVAHIIEPRRDAQPGRLDQRSMPWASVWFEVNASDSEGLLREGGYHEFPVMAPRWEVSGEGVYGDNCPGMACLGDARAIQLGEKRLAQQTDFVTRPPLRGPAQLKRASLIPGDYTAMPGHAAQQIVEPIVRVESGHISETRLSIAEHEKRIGSAHYADLWLAFSQFQDGKLTATEVEARTQERLIQLGPVVVRLVPELLDPLIERTVGILLRRGGLPPPPRELQGQRLTIEHQSTLVLAQRLGIVKAMERSAQFAMALAASPQLSGGLDKLNVDKMIDRYGEVIGLDPDLLRPEAEVAALRKARAQQAQAQQMGEAMATAAKGARDLAGAGLTDDNALSRLLSAAPVAGGEA